MQWRFSIIFQYFQFSSVQLFFVYYINVHFLLGYENFSNFFYIRKKEFQRFYSRRLSVPWHPTETFFRHRKIGTTEACIVRKFCEFPQHSTRGPLSKRASGSLYTFCQTNTHINSYSYIVLDIWTETIYLCTCMFFLCCQNDWDSFLITKLR